LKTHLKTDLNTFVKNHFLLVAVLIFSSLCAHAGNMFGPAPFRNGSPLVSGVDGTYQATARAENVTGIFRFAYSGGSQTTAPAQNSWIFFVNGYVCKGSVTANINESMLDGILDKDAGIGGFSANSAGGNSSTKITLPYVSIIEPGNSASGTFTGKLNSKSPAGAFNGSGVLTPSQAGNNTVIAISDSTTTDPFGNVVTSGVTSSNSTYPIPAGEAPATNFKFRGVRLSTSATSSSATN